MGAIEEPSRPAVAGHEAGIEFLGRHLLLLKAERQQGRTLRQVGAGVRAVVSDDFVHRSLPRDGRKENVNFKSQTNENWKSRIRKRFRGFPILHSHLFEI